MRVYISGPHGAGKSSLIRGICNYSSNFISYPDRYKFPHIEPSGLRQKSKIAKIFLEHCDQLDFEKDNPSKIILIDRCIYDNLIYSEAFCKLGWINEEEKNTNKDIISKFFTELPGDVILLNPPYSSLVDHLKERWTKHDKKYREDNFEYLRAVHDEFKLLPSYFAGNNFLCLEDKLTVDQEVEKCVDWIRDKFCF